jgi:outer membrane protein assembly factor BamB
MIRQQHERAFCVAPMVLMTLFVAARLRADDWPQWMGPQRDGIWRETDILETLPAAGLPVLWRAKVAGGYSGPAVAGDRVYLTDYVRSEGALTNNPTERTTVAGRERVVCFDRLTGERLWEYAYECPYSISYASGPRCTPTVHEGRVYAVGAEGMLTCLEASSGRLLWQIDFKRAYSAPTPIWGFCGHPLVDGDLLICLVGGEGSVAVAFDRLSGLERWRAISASESGYSPPSIIEAAGRRQLMIWDADKLNALDPGSGHLLWSEPLKPMYGMSIMAPQVADVAAGRVLFASGIGRVGSLYRLQADSPGVQLLWRGEPKSAVYCANSTPFIEGDSLYGCDCDTGMLTAVDITSGERRWETLEPTTGGERRGKHGTAFLVRHRPPGRETPSEGRTWIFSETGDLILASLTPKGYEEIGRTHLLDPTNECFGREVVWSHPAFAHRCCFVRNDRELLCVSLAR